MLQTVRDYARERLAERDETARFGDRHLDWFLSASEPANVLRHPDAYASWPAIEPDTDNFRAAVRWALELRALHPLAVLSSNLFPWFWQSGRLLEARGWLDEAEVLVDHKTDVNDAALLLLWAGAARALTGDLAGAEPMVKGAASTFRELGDESDAALALRTADEIRHRLRMPIWPQPLLRPMHDSLVTASSGHQPPNLGDDPWFVLRQTLPSA